MRLIESAKGLEAAKDGSYPVVLISPGQGSSGYYHEEVIREYAPEAFPKGTHVYLDHLKEGETRSVERLLGTLIEDTVVDESGQAINRFKPLSKHAEWIEEVRGAVGLSVSVRGTGREDVIDGRKTVVVESLEPHVTNTVDLVSYAGRGGRFLESYLEDANQEDNRTRTEPSAGNTEGTEVMELTDEQIGKIATAVVAQLPQAETPSEPQTVADPEDRAAAVEATVKVESAEISASLKAKLIEGIKAGDYDVDQRIADDIALREEIRTELTESLGAGAGASALNESAKDDTYEIEGW